MNKLRQTILSDTEIVAAKPRFGLFSQPPPIAVGDNSFFIAKRANKGEDGKPKTKPRNMLGGSSRTGLGKKSYIHVPESIYQKDPYKDPFKIDLDYDKKIHGKSAIHQTNFRPASGIKTVATPSYLYTEQQDQRKIKVRKDQNGRVRTQPSNVITNPTSKIENKLFKHVQHMRDQYDRKRWIQNQDKLVWRSKVKGETMFKSMSHGGNFFSKEKTVFGMDDHAKMILSRKRPFKFGNYNKLNHQNRFKLARRGHGDPIGRYPEFIQANQRVKTQQSIRRQNTSKSEGQKELWRPTSGLLSRPTPSISFMATNIRKCVR